MTQAAPTPPAAPAKAPPTPEGAAPDDDAAHAEALRLLAADLPESDGAPATGDKPAEPAEKADGEPDETKADKPKDRVFAALKRKQEAVKRDRERLAQERAEAESQIAARAAELRAEDERLARWREAEKLAKDSPRKVLDLLGIDLGRLSEDMLRDGSPDAKADAVARELAELRKALEERDKKEREAAERQQQAHTAEQAHKAFVGHVREQATSYAYLAAFDDKEIAEYGDEMANALARAGHKFTYDDVAKSVNDHFAKQYERLAKVGAKPDGAEESPDAERDTAQDSPAKPEAPRARTPAISNRASAERSGKQRPMTDKERHAEALKLLRSEP